MRRHLNHLAFKLVLLAAGAWHTAQWWGTRRRGDPMVEHTNDSAWDDEWEAPVIGPDDYLIPRRGDRCPHCGTDLP